jgi:hypothetical protein
VTNNEYTNINCYEVLGISWNAGPQEIRIAYFKKSKQSHPDLGGSNELQQLVNSAFEILSDPLKRESHDRYWRNISGSNQKNYDSRSDTANSKKSSTFDNLYNRVSNIFNFHLNNLKTEQYNWVKDKKSSYRQKVEFWQQEQETLFHNSMENIKNTYEEKLKDKNLYFMAAILAAIVSFIGLILILRISSGFVHFSIYLIWVVSLIIWIVYRNNKNVFIDGFAIPITDMDGFENVTDFLKDKLYSQKINLGFNSLSFGLKNWKEKIDEFVNNEWVSYYNEKERSLLKTKEIYMRYISEICEISGRNTTYDSSEEQTARRIAITFFFMGYIPKTYIENTRMFKLSDGSNNIAIRFRHRRGAPTNIAYVRRMVEEMNYFKAYRGFLFCTPGLSGNAKIFAKNNKVTWYSLESMNEWIENVNKAGYEGPQGDVFVHLDNLVIFLRNISLLLPIS